MSTENPIPNEDPTERTPIDRVLREITSSEERGPSTARRLQMIQSLRAYSSMDGAVIDEFLVRDIQKLNTELRGLQENQEALKQIVAKLTAQPLFPAIYLGPAMTDEGAGAVVSQGSNRRVVGLAESVEPQALQVGDEVLLGPELNVVLRKSPYPLQGGGETARFKRRTDAGGLVLDSRDEEVVVVPAAQLADSDLAAGDIVRWDRHYWMAFEKVGRPGRSDLLLETNPGERFEHIGGLDPQIARLQRSIRLHRDHSEVAGRYGLRRMGGVLLAGPPGTGKTMLARALANWLAELSGTGRANFMNVKPAGLHSMWYGQSEENYREAFREARRIGDAEPEVPVVMFFDEIDAGATARGGATARVNDSVLSAFLSELDGFGARGNILVVGATNRIDALDPALLRAGRFGDCILEIPRPGRVAAREIFRKHLPETVPVAVNGDGDADSRSLRESLIETALTRIYAPNGSGEVATLVFRDGRRQSVEARDVVTGASIAKIVGAASELACVRELDGGPSGLSAADLLSAIDEEIEQRVGILTPRNCRRHLDDLPQDVDVVSVLPVENAVPQKYRYLQIA